MRIHRSYLLALLLPVLLDVLVVFTARSYVVDDLSYCEREAVEALEDFREAEERLEKEEDNLFSCLLQSFHGEVASLVVFGQCRFFPVISNESFFASGWMMPLRI